MAEALNIEGERENVCVLRQFFAVLLTANPGYRRSRITRSMIGVCSLFGKVLQTQPQCWSVAKMETYVSFIQSFPARILIRLYQHKYPE